MTREFVNTINTNLNNYLLMTKNTLIALLFGEVSFYFLKKKVVPTRLGQHIKNRVHFYGDIIGVICDTIRFIRKITKKTFEFIIALKTPSKKLLQYVKKIPFIKTEITVDKNPNYNVTNINFKTKNKKNKTKKLPI